MRSLLSLLLLFFSCIGYSASQLLDTKMEIDMEDLSDKIAIRVICKVAVDAGTNRIPLRMIGGENSALEIGLIRVEGREFSYELTNTNAKVQEGAILMRRPFIIDKEVEVIIDYKLGRIDPEKEKHKLLLPLLFVDLEPGSTTSDTFDATISLSKEYALKGIFPAMKWEKLEEGDLDVYSFSLQVIPAWVSFNLYKGQLPLFALEQVVDISVLLVLLVIFLVGWRKMKQ